MIFMTNHDYRWMDSSFHGMLESNEGVQSTMTKQSQVKPSRSSAQIVKLRRARLADLDVLVYQRSRMWEDMGEKNRNELRTQNRVYRSWARSRLKNGSLVGWVAETNRRRIVAGGTLWLRPAVPRPGFVQGVQPFLLSLYTEPQWRGRGLASRILDEAIKWVKKEGYREVLLHSSPLGKGLYVRRRFKRTSEMRLKFT